MLPIRKVTWLSPAPDRKTVAHSRNGYDTPDAQRITFEINNRLKQDVSL